MALCVLNGVFVGFGVLQFLNGFHVFALYLLVFDGLWKNMFLNGC